MFGRWFKMKINVERDESKREKYVYSHLAVTFWLLLSKAATRGVLQKKMFLDISQNSQENTCTKVSFLGTAFNFIKRETLAQVFSWEFCEISKNTFFCRTPLDDCFCFVLTQKCYFFSWFNSIVEITWSFWLIT